MRSTQSSHGVRVRLRRRPSDGVADNDEFEVQKPPPLTLKQIKILRKILKRGSNPQARTVIRLALQIEANVDDVRSWFANNRFEQSPDSTQRIRKGSDCLSSTLANQWSPNSSTLKNIMDLRVTKVTGPPFCIHLRSIARNDRLMIPEVSPSSASNKSSDSNRVPRRKSFVSSRSSIKTSASLHTAEVNDDEDKIDDDEDKLDDDNDDEDFDDGGENDNDDSEFGNMDNSPQDGDEEDVESNNERGESSSVSDNSDALLTVRQRAMRKRARSPSPIHSSDADENVVEKNLSEALALKRSELTRRRKLTQSRLEEEAKQDTVERLLKKTSVRKQRADRIGRRKVENKLPSHIRRRNEMKGAAHTTIRYRTFLQNNGVIPCTMSTLTFPSGYVIPSELINSLSPHVKPMIMCAAPGCSNIRRYTCARSLQPLCSLQCFQIVNQMNQKVPSES